MHYEHSIRRLENAYMDSPEMSFTRFQPEDIILHRLRIRRGKIELKILEKLSRREANVYELRWKRLRDVNVHYSTVLRALERLEKKKLVKIISSSKVGRRYKTYANTLSGDLVLALAKKGLDGTAKILAENSPSFRECLGAHSSLGQDHYMFLTREVVWEISMGKKGNVITHHDLDFYVRKAELLWIRRNVIDVLKGHSFILFDLRL